MTGRLKEICLALPKARTLCDVGCDHGYCAQYALKHNLCERVIITDISAGSLQKAQSLLKEEIASGRCIPVLCDGLTGVKECDCVLIAGLGGEEIIRILSERALPAKFVLQPMRNGDKVRSFLLERGARIHRDYTFGDGGYYYDLIAGEGAGGDTYSEFEVLFGRDNLRELPAAFLLKIAEERMKIKQRLTRKMSVKSREALLQKLSVLEVVTDAIDDDL